MPTWAKWLIVFGFGVAVGQSPNILVGIAHGIAVVITRNHG